MRLRSGRYASRHSKRSDEGRVGNGCGSRGEREQDKKGRKEHTAALKQMAALKKKMAAKAKAAKKKLSKEDKQIAALKKKMSKYKKGSKEHKAAMRKPVLLHFLQHLQ